MDGASVIKFASLKKNNYCLHPECDMKNIGEKKIVKKFTKKKWK